MESITGMSKPKPDEDEPWWVHWEDDEYEDWLEIIREKESKEGKI